MNPFLVITIIVSYFILLFLISRITSKNADNQTFFSGNRKSPWFVVAFSMIGAAISGVTFVSVPGMVNTSGFSYLQMVLGFCVGQIIIAFILVPMFYRMNLTSIYQYLQSRFGISSYKTGAWFFFISKMLGASVRLFVVCIVLQLFIFKPLGLSFYLNSIITVFLVWLYTFQGGVKTLIWTDTLKTFSLILSSVLIIYFIGNNLGLSFENTFNDVWKHENSKIFYFENYKDSRYFWKQFLAGIFLVIATTGLDQDFMQKVLSCKNPKDSQKNLITSAFMQIFIILLFLMLGVLLYLFAEKHNLHVTKDELFPSIAVHDAFPLIVGVFFVIGLISAAFASAGSALTALTTSFTVDILGALDEKNKENKNKVTNIRMIVHICMTIVMGIVIIIINILNNTSIINAVYILASYTYGPILGLFIFGIFTKRKIKDRFVPLVAIIAPILCLLIDLNSEKLLFGYQLSHERLLLNALFTIIGMFILIKSRSNELKTHESQQNNIK